MYFDRSFLYPYEVYRESKVGYCFRAFMSVCFLSELSLSMLAYPELSFTWLGAKFDFYKRLW